VKIKPSFFSLRLMLRMFYAILLLSIIGCGSIDQSDKEAKIEKLKRLAEKSDSVQDLRGAIDYYSQILRIDSTNILARVNRARALIWVGKTGKGFRELATVIRIAPNKRTYFIRGMAYVKIELYDSAFKDFQRSLDFDSEFGEAYYGLSYLLESQGKYDSALSLCRFAKAYNCPEDMVRSRKYVLFEKMQLHDSLITVLNDLLKSDPENKIWYNNRGLERNKVRLYSEALNDLNKAIDLDSNFAFAYNNRAETFLNLDKPENALNDVNKSLSLNDSNAYAYKNRGEIYIALKQKKNACLDVSHALKLSKDDKLTKEIVELQKHSCSR